MSSAWQHVSAGFPQAQADGHRPFSWSVTRVVAFLAMRKPSETHDQLISLQRLCFDGHTLDFQQAFLTLGAQDGPPVWSCTLRVDLQRQRVSVGAAAAEDGGDRLEQ
jgi:hypothetical protein